MVIAGLLHDVVEDTDGDPRRGRTRFGPEVAALVDHCSEVKLDATGREAPWIDRKRDHLAALAGAPADARAVVLADKIHNLLSIACDLEDGRPVWSLFHAERDQVLWYYREAIATLAAGAEPTPRIAALRRGEARAVRTSRRRGRGPAVVTSDGMQRLKNMRPLWEGSRKIGKVAGHRLNRGQGSL